MEHLILCAIVARPNSLRFMCCKITFGSTGVRKTSVCALSLILVLAEYLLTVIALFPTKQLSIFLPIVSNGEQVHRHAQSHKLQIHRYHLQRIELATHHSISR